jgi:hypothetical protein
MKTVIFALSFFALTRLNAQHITRDYVINWIKAIDTTYKPDSVVAYYIDRELYYTYDTVKFNDALQKIDLRNLSGIYYSKNKTDNHVPGKGSIFIATIRKLETAEIKRSLRDAKKLFVDNYISFSQHIFENAKDPVLTIDNRRIHHTEAKGVLNKLEPNDIYDIRVSASPVPAAIYGQNSRNGIVQIWTRKYMKM